MQKKHYLSSHTSDSPNETVWRSSSGASAACGSAVTPSAPLGEPVPE